MNNLYTTETVEKQRIEMDRKNANHFNASNCDEMDRPLAIYDLYKTDADGIVWELIEVIKNTSKKCPTKHNSDVAVYQIFKGAIGYDL